MSEGKGRRKIFTVLVAVVLIAVFFFVFSEPLRPELSAAPRWTIDLSASVASAEASAQDRVDASAVSFSTASRFGYFGTDGSIGFVGEATGPVPMSDSSYVSAELVPGGTNYSLRSPVGARVAELDASAPFYSSGRLFSAQADGSGVAAYDGKGNRLWSYTFPCQLSAFSAGEGLAVGGTVDGWLEGVDSGGRRAFSFAPGGSRLQVVLGLGVSRSGNWIAAVTGVDRQRLVVLGRGGADYRVASHRYLDSDYREPVRVVVLDDDRHVLYRRADGIGVWSVDGAVDELLPVKADDFDVSLDAERGLALLVARRGKKAEVVAFRLPATLLGRVPLPDGSEYVRLIGSSVYFGSGDSISRFDFMEE